MRTSALALEVIALSCDSAFDDWALRTTFESRCTRTRFSSVVRPCQRRLVDSTTIGSASSTAATPLGVKLGPHVVLVVGEAGTVGELSAREAVDQLGDAGGADVQVAAELTQRYPVAGSAVEGTQDVVALAADARLAPALRRGHERRVCVEQHEVRLKALGVAAAIGVPGSELLGTRFCQQAVVTQYKVQAGRLLPCDFSSTLDAPGLLVRIGRYLRAYVLIIDTR